MKFAVKLVLMTFVFCSVTLAQQGVPIGNELYGSQVFAVMGEDGTLTIRGNGRMKDFESKTPWYQARNNITKVVIQSGVTSIGSSAFRDCENLTTVTLPNSITTIGNGAFYNCVRLTSITLSNNLTSIGEMAFANTGLTSITIPKGVTSIGKEAFGCCRDLATVNIEGSIHTDIFGVMALNGTSLLQAFRAGGSGTYKASATIPVVCNGSASYISTDWAKELSPAEQEALAKRLEAEQQALTKRQEEETKQREKEAIRQAEIEQEKKTSFVDPRNGKKYKIVKIGNLVWMAENLLTDGAGCYREVSNCEKYGGLYTWDDAQKACPNGWRLPTSDEWSDLINATNSSSKKWGNNSGQSLKSKSPGWNGTDSHGFSALPGGYYDDYSKFQKIGTEGRWWSSTSKEFSRDVYNNVEGSRGAVKTGEQTYSSYSSIEMKSKGDGVGIYSRELRPGTRYSVRCIRE